MNTRQIVPACPVEPISGVLLPVEVTEIERGEISHRLNNRLQVIVSAVHLILCDTQEQETRTRAKAIQTATRGIVDDINELLGPGISGLYKKS